jgi:hypothetical protein
MTDRTRPTFPARPELVARGPKVQLDLAAPGPGRTPLTPGGSDAPVVRPSGDGNKVSGCAPPLTTRQKPSLHVFPRHHVTRDCGTGTAAVELERDRVDVRLGQVCVAHCRR